MIVHLKEKDVLEKLNEEPISNAPSKYFKSCYTNDTTEDSGGAVGDGVSDDTE